MKYLLAALLVFVSLPAIAEDACSMQIPGSLKVEIEKAFPQFRTPVVTDNLPSYVEEDIAGKGNGCLGVATADFDGDGANDFLLVLTAKKGSGAIVLVALSRGSGWKFSKLNAWPSGRPWLYVASKKSATYAYRGAVEGPNPYDPPSEPGEVNPLKCHYSAAVFGVSGSSEVVYCYEKGTWQHAWIY